MSICITFQIFFRETLYTLIIISKESNLVRRYNDEQDEGHPKKRWKKEYIQCTTDEIKIIKHITQAEIKTSE